MFNKDEIDLIVIPEVRIDRRILGGPRDINVDDFIAMRIDYSQCANPDRQLIDDFAIVAERVAKDNTGKVYVEKLIAHDNAAKRFYRYIQDLRQKA